jgi:hypothetical protein
MDAAGAAGGDVGPMLPSGLGGAAAEMSLLSAAAKKARRTAKREGRQLYGSELSLSLSETAARQRALSSRKRGARRGTLPAGKELAQRLVSKVGMGAA